MNTYISICPILYERPLMYLKKQPIKKTPTPPKKNPHKSTKGTKNIFWMNLWYFIIIDVIILFLFDYEFNLGIYGILESLVSFMLLVTLNQMFCSQMWEIFFAR